MNPSAKSLIIDLLSTLRRGSMPVRALVAAGTLFGFPENNLRVALARLRAAGSVERDERGRYRLGPAARALHLQVVGWREVEERVGPWQGGWIGVHSVPKTGGSRERSRGAQARSRALRLLGFRSLAPGLEIRPDNLNLGPETLGERLRALGLPPEAPVFRLHDLDRESDSRARELWDVAALRAGYAESRHALAESTRGLATLSDEEAMVETFLLGGRVLRQVVLDPLLPEPILPGAERRALVDAMRDYDRIGRSAWAAFLARFEVPHLRNPVDLRFDEGLRATPLASETPPMTGDSV